MIPDHLVRSEDSRARVLRRCGVLGCVLLVACGHAPQRVTVSRLPPPEAPDGVRLLIRSDDAGMSHAVNMATKRVLETGLPVSVSVMFACPWYQEIVEILREYPDAAVGVHLTLNSEWRHYRWGPVIGQEAAPSLVDEHGYFFHSAAEVYRNDPDLGEVERELRAQIERALATGLRIDYVDYHMGTISGHPPFQAIVERLGAEYGLGLVGYYGEQRLDPQYRAAPEEKLDSLVTAVGRLTPGYHLLVTHPGLDTPELAALVDMNQWQPLADMSRHRQGELDALTAEAFREALARHRVTPITYRELLGIVRATAPSSPRR